MERMRIILILAWTSLLSVSCQHVEKFDSVTPQPIVQDKYNLKEDREAFAEIRKEIPEQKKAENDELAYILNLMGEVKRSPHDIREQFDKVLRKKRELFDKDMKKKREDFTHTQKKERDAFDKDLKEQREVFRAQKHKSEETRSFYDDLELKRKDFYNSQREARDEFEANFRDQRKDFDDYIRGKTQEFNQEHRAYTKKYEDDQKLKKQLNKNSVDPQFQDLMNKPSTYLKTED